MLSHARARPGVHVRLRLAAPHPQRAPLRACRHLPQIYRYCSYAPKWSYITHALVATQGARLLRATAARTLLLSSERHAAAGTAATMVAALALRLALSHSRSVSR